MTTTADLVTLEAEVEEEEKIVLGAADPRHTMYEPQREVGGGRFVRRLGAM